MLAYKIKPGDSLSLIAQRFGFPDWQPLWIYNTRFSPGARLAGDNPNKIPAGATILIPRTKSEYDETVAALWQLYYAADRDAQEQFAQLRADRQEMRGFGKAIDTTAAVATAMVGVVGVAVKALGTKYAALRIGKELLKPAQKAAEHFLPEGDAEQGTETAAKGAKIVVKSAASAAQKQAISLATDLPFKGGQFGKDFLKGAAKSAAQEVAKKKLTEHGMRAEDSAQFVSLLCAVLEKGAKAVESIQPSWLAQKYVQRMNNGESPEDSFAAAERQIRSSQEQSQRRIRESIQRLSQERDSMYSGGGTAGTAPAAGKAGARTPAAGTAGTQMPVMP